MATNPGESRTALLRNEAFGNYLKINGKWELIGAGFTKLDENPGAQSEGETYINEATASASVTGYETTFPFETRLMPGQKAPYAVLKVAKNHYTGDKAKFDYVIVDLYNPIGEPSEEKAEYTARQFSVSTVVDSITGNGGEKENAAGNFVADGDPILGKFDTVAREFTAGDFKGKYDEADG